MLSYYADLLSRALFSIPPSLGGNMLGLIWPVIIVLCGELIACLVYGWRTVMNKRRKASRIGLAALGICYALLFGWCALAANYQDHSNLASKVAGLQQTNDTNSERQRYVVLEAQSKCAEMVGENRTLGQQNRDQQNTINHCQSDAIKLLTPQPFKMTGLNLGSSFGTDAIPGEYNVLMLSNQTVSPARLQLHCSKELIDVFGDLVGDTTSVWKGNDKLSPYLYTVEMTSPAWGPESPLRLKIRYKGPGDIQCKFTRM